MAVHSVHLSAEESLAVCLLTERVDENLDGSLGDMYDLVVRWFQLNSIFTSGSSLWINNHAIVCLTRSLNSAYFLPRAAWSATRPATSSGPRGGMTWTATRCSTTRWSTTLPTRPPSPPRSPSPHRHWCSSSTQPHLLRFCVFSKFRWGCVWICVTSSGSMQPTLTPSSPGATGSGPRMKNKPL